MKYLMFMLLVIVSLKNEVVWPAVLGFILCIVHELKEAGEVN